VTHMQHPCLPTITRCVAIAGGPLRRKLSEGPSAGKAPAGLICLLRACSAADCLFREIQATTEGSPRSELRSALDCSSCLHPNAMLSDVPSMPASRSFARSAQQVITIDVFWGMQE
jgi:hypothetical protein